VIQHPGFEVEPWAVRETTLDLKRLAQTESVFALANGHLGLRGNLDEGEPFGLPGTYLAGFYEKRPLPYAEPGYGDPEDGQTIVNATNGKIMRLTLEDEAFDVRRGELRKHERLLDLRAGVLRRSVEWVSPTGRLVRVSSTRIVSFRERSIAAICYEVEPLDDEVQVVLQSELVTNEMLPSSEDDPRTSAALASSLAADFSTAEELRATLIHTTKASGLTVAAAMDHRLDGPTDTRATIRSDPDLARLTITATPAPGRPLRVTKFLGYSWSGERSVPALRDHVEAAVDGAVHTGWGALLQRQRAFLDMIWERADIEIDGDAELQQAVRFALFHTLQAGARGEQGPIAAKGLTGPGYDGHTFWDTEAFVLPLLMLGYTGPRAVADALRWRHQTLDLARERARSLGLRGAAFPWRTIAGQECSGYWPAGAAAFHINAAIANAVERYLLLTEDETFARDAGVELLVETARLWRSLGHHDVAGQFRIPGVTGPDEYSAVADNNVYTNLMAARNLRAAADVIERHRELATPLGVDDEEVASWRGASEAIFIPYDASLGVHPQAEGFTEHQEWDFESIPSENYPLLLHYPYFDLYRKQVVKQADLVMALFYAGEYFTPEEKARNFAFYERLTVRDSSLSACIQAAVAAEVGHVELAYDYFGEAALLDLDDLQHDTRDGVHIASLAGACIVAIAGFAGLRESDGTLSFLPRLPHAITRLALNVHTRRTTFLRVEVEPAQATYTLLEGETVEIQHHGEPITVTAAEPVRRPIPPPNELEPPTQPWGRAPRRRLASEISRPPAG
jgi:alpha,alpha-trehalose phosphorylase